MKTETLIAKLKAIYEEILRLEPLSEAISKTVHPDFRPSARNLIRYLVLRDHDLRKLHDPLSDLGISSLRSAEGYVLTNLHRVLHLLHLLENKPWPKRKEPSIIGYEHSKYLIRTHSNLLFNRPPSFNTHEVMVTMPEEAADDLQLIEKMALNGMTIARVNLSHGEEGMWMAMVENIREASRKTGKDLRIYMDLAGPKLRIIFPEGVKSLPIREGGTLSLHKTPVDRNAYEKARAAKDRQLPVPVQLSIPGVIDALQPGDQVFLDDGMIRATVTETGGETAVVKVVKTFKSRLKPDNGMNIPNTVIKLPSLTDRDLETLPFVARHADLLGYSFVNSEEDVANLYERLDALEEARPGVVFKIENLNAFNRLPMILLEGMKHNRIGVMIARGDLAVEIGFDRISEVQNEILWLCEAAHVPVIWATQVLDTLAKKGIATRAEISDAALSVRSECVMLNKGPFILDAISELRTILGRMEPHSSKNKNALRPLQIARKNLEFLKGTPMED
jgi:pyruvate kinase